MSNTFSALLRKPTPPRKDRRRAYFDADFYARRYGIGEGGFEDYIASGWRAGRMPNPFFDPLAYARHHGLSGEEPLAHFLDHWREAGFCSPAFDTAAYLAANPDVAEVGVEPLGHFLQYGLPEGRSPGFSADDLPARKREAPLFDWSAVEERLAITQAGGGAEAYRNLVDDWHYTQAYREHLGSMFPADHYAKRGWMLGLKPNPFFDPAWYAAHHGLDAGQDPLLHHVQTGSRPTPFFCEKSYLAHNPDAAAAGSAFTHYVTEGASQRRSLGLDPRQLAALRKLEPGYDWAVLDYLGLWPEAPQEPAAEPVPAGAMPPARSRPDPLPLAALDHRGGTCALVGFDVWDTVLRRACHPDALKLHAAAVLLDHVRAAGRGDALTAADLFHLRRLAEYRAADQHYEYTYQAMAQEWLRLAGFTDSAEIARVAAAVEEAEIAREIAVTRPDPTALAMLDALGDVPKVAISDFYLSGKALARILAAHGLDRHFRRIYVSSDLMKTKREGSLFSHVLASEGVTAADMLHVGDNAHADHAVPTRMGIEALLFTDTVEDRRKRHFNARFQAELREDGARLAASLLPELTLAEPVHAETAAPAEGADADAPPGLGAASSVELLAIAFAGFGRFVLDRAAASGAQDIWFATREGDFFRRVCALLLRCDADRGNAAFQPELRMIEVSRRATFAPSLREVSLREMMRMWSLYSQQSLGAMGRSLNLPDAELAAHGAAYGIVAEETITHPWCDPRMIALFDDSDFQAWMSDQILTQRRELMAYLERIGFAPAERRNRFMVDIGWRGSIQDALAFLCKGRIDGAYMALYRYLAEQPANAAKHGFLTNHNLEPDGYSLGDVAALEFVANGPGGSVTGYAGGEALREAFASEEAFLAAAILPLQDRILATIEALVPQLSSAALSADGWRSLARHAVDRYTAHPDAEIADLFQQLEHNETFGTGEIDRVADGAGRGDLAGLNGAALHAGMTRLLTTGRWPQAWLAASSTQSSLDEMSLDRKLTLPRLPCLVRAPALVRSLGQRVSIFAPQPVRGSGGHRTIYNFAKALDQAGFTVDMFSEKTGDYAYKEEELAGSGVRLHDRWFSGIVPDAAVATIFYSAGYVRDFFPKSVAPFYFVQDFEAAFSPVSDGFVRGENSYALGHTPICIGRWLPHVLRAQFGVGGASAGLGVDTAIYRPLDSAADGTRNRTAGTTRSPRIAVLYQPEKWRRLPETCIEALARVKAARPDVEVVFYGSAEKPNVPWPSIHLGLVNDLNALNTLYNSARVGLCISLTNPSRVPFEMMAAGCVPVDVYRYNNLFDYVDGSGLLAYQSADSLANAMLHLLNDEEDWQQRSALGIAVAAERTLRWEQDAAVNTLEHVLTGGDLDAMPAPLPSYSAAPFLSPTDDTPSVRAWCAWQQKLAHTG